MAEFVIIVAGVLVALAVDSLVERMHERELEASYLRRLETEVRNDSILIVSGIAFIDRADSALVQLLQLRRAGVTPPDGARLIDGLMRARVSGIPAALSQNTFDELRSTGAIRFIRDAETRSEIGSHYATIVRSRAQLETDYTHYPLALSEVLPGEVQRMWLSDQPVPAAAVDEAIRDLARAPDLDRHLRSKRGYLAIQRVLLGRLLASADTLLAVLHKQ